VLDHSSDTFSFGGKAGIDATEKLPEELQVRRRNMEKGKAPEKDIAELLNAAFIKAFRIYKTDQGERILKLGIDPSGDPTLS